MSQGVTKLRIDDEAFVVASLIERCPKLMMLRELVQNGLEAAVLAPAGQRRVDIVAARIGSARKLALRNTGPGMNADELFRMCDIAASLGKPKALDRNFGMGAKVASLPANRLGMRYRSCKAGRVHEVLIGKRGGIYGRVQRTDPLTRQRVDVADVTGLARAEDLPLDHDWTEVVLLGDRAEQDTVAEPFDGDPEVDPDWIATGLDHRFYRLPEGVEVRLHPGTHRGDGIVAFRPVTARMDAFGRHEAVRLADGTVLRYLFDPPDPAAPRDGESLVAIVFRDEMYDVRHGWRWAQIAPRFGLAFGVQHVSVHIELPPDAAVLPDGYRQFLRHGGGAQTQVEVEDYAALVLANRPDWLIAELRALGPDTRIAASLREELSALLRELGVRRAIRGAASPPAPEPAPGQAPSPATAEVAASPTPAEPPDLPRDPAVLEAPPEIVLLRDSRHVHDRLLSGRAASYDAISHELFVNMTYPAFSGMARALTGELSRAEDADPRDVERAVTEAVEETMIRRIGRALVHGLAKREAGAGWNRWQLQSAISAEALTVVADDFIWSLPDARAHAALVLASGAAP